MKTTKRILAATSALLFVGAATIPATALDVGLGGGGVSIGGGPAGSEAGATVGGGAGDILSLGGSTSQAGGTLALTNNDGNLIDLGQTGNTTDGTINLGGVGLDGLGLAGLGLGGIDAGGLLPGNGTGGDGGATVRVNAAFASLSGAEQHQLKVRCRSVLTSPTAFDPGLVALCRMIARLGQTD